MQEVAKPAGLVGRGGCWFESGTARIHAGIEEDFGPARNAHPALEVEGLQEILGRCESDGAPANYDTPFVGFRRLYILEPFGNRLELLECKVP